MRRFFLLIFGLLIGSNFVSWWTLHSFLARLNVPENCRWLLGAFLVMQVAGLLVILGARLLGHQPGTGLGRPLLSLLLIWNLLLALPTAVVSLLAWIIVALVARPDGVPGPAGRTAALLAIGLPFALALAATLLALWQLTRFRIQRLTLRIPGLPAALRGFTIAHLSDLHIGKLTRGRVLDDMVAATNRLEADVILLTGDLINFSLSDLPRGIALLREMKARHGLFLCEGNHDLIENEASFESAARASGLRFLMDEAATLDVKGQPVRVIGLRWDDGYRRRNKANGVTPESALAPLLAGGPPGAFDILLAHHPDAFDAAAAAGIPLTLAGHTHGGQLMLTPRFGFGPWLYRYWSGLYRRGASQLVVSNGTGNWFPLRLGAPAEIIHLTLEPEAEAPT